MVASGTGIKPGEALHREPLDAGDVPCPSTSASCPVLSCPGRRGAMGCFGIENKHYRSQSGMVGSRRRKAWKTKMPVMIAAI
jgi:hypothetical protein